MLPSWDIVLEWVLAPGGNSFFPCISVKNLIRLPYAPHRNCGGKTFFVFGFPVTNTLLTSWIVMGILIRYTVLCNKPYWCRI